MSEKNPPRLLIISHDVVGSRMAGPGIRLWETARLLAAQQPVTLVAPQPIDLQAPGVTTGTYTWGDTASLAGWLRNASVVFANGFVLRLHPELAAIPQPLALDLYDPVILENLEATRTAPLHERTEQHAVMRGLLEQQLAAGDFLLCATERQRDLYIGALMHSGRIAPHMLDADPRLRNLIDVVPFGLPPEPPAKQAPALRGVVPGIGAHDPLLLWSGGLWDWLDPQTLVEAIPLVLKHHPQARLVFLAGRHPGPVAPMQAPQQARERAATLGLLDSSIFFYTEWVPYERRADFLLEADLAVSLHHSHLETTYAAVRSRFLDHLWAGLPSVVSAGDAAADLVERYQLGRVAAINDPTAVAAAITALLDDPQERKAAGTRARAQAQEFVWERVLQPLAHFTHTPWRLPKGSINAGPQPANHMAERTMATYTHFKAAVARLHELWKLEPQEPGSSVPLLGQAKRIANTLTRWYLQPVIEQQNAFNAATVHAVQALSDTVERLVQEHAPLRSHVADIELHLLDIDDAQTRIAQRLASDE